MIYKAAVASLPKKRKEDVNEDGFIIDSKNGIYAVFDGVGGAGNADFASSYAAKFISQQIELITDEQRHNSNFLDQWLINIIHTIHEELSSKNKLEFGAAGQTTASILVINDNPYDPEVLTINVGDSRIYGWNKANQALIQLTVDDSTFPDPRLDEVESREELTESIDFNFARRNYVSRALGTGDIGNVDVNYFPIENFNGFLLTSDGVHDNLSRREIANFLLKPFDIPEALISDLVDFAKNRSEDLNHLRHKADDITAMYVQIKPD